MRASLAGLFQLRQALFAALRLHLAAWRVVQAVDLDRGRCAGLSLADRRGTLAQLQAVALLGAAFSLELLVLLGDVVPELQRVVSEGCGLPILHALRDVALGADFRRHAVHLAPLVEARQCANGEDHGQGFECCLRVHRVPLTSPRKAG